MNIRNSRNESSPYFATSSSVSWVLPRDFDIRSPSMPRIWPWLKTFLQGSFCWTSPMSRIIFVNSRA